MKPAFDVQTSVSLLEKLRVFEDHQSWARFVALYVPMIEAWGNRFSLPNVDVEELTARILSKLLEALPRFHYDPDKGTFRGWLKTITHRELTNFARERQRRLPGDVATGQSTVYELLQEHAGEVDDLVAGMHDRSEGMLRSMQDALKEVEAACGDDEQRSWQMFKRIFLEDQPIEGVAREFRLSYHATAMRVQRIKKKVRTRAMQLASERGLTS